MASLETIQALEKCNDAIQVIREKLKPLLKVLEEDTATAKQRAMAQAAIALSIGTLRYMGARLRGLDQGRKHDDPLRQELNHMRKLLVQLQKKQQEAEEKEEQKSDEKKENDGSKRKSDTPSKSTKRRRTS